MVVETPQDTHGVNTVREEGACVRVGGEGGGSLAIWETPKKWKQKNALRRKVITRCCASHVGFL
jgi:hypothetical protein